MLMFCQCSVLTQFFSYLTFDKRFNLVTATLHKAVRDILPMLVILGSVLFTFCTWLCNLWKEVGRFFHCWPNYVDVVNYNAW